MAYSGLKHWPCLCDVLIQCPMLFKRPWRENGGGFSKWRRIRSFSVLFHSLSLSAALSSGLADLISSRLLDPCVWGYGPASPHGSPACCLSPALCSNLSSRSRWKEHWEAVPSSQAPPPWMDQERGMKAPLAECKSNQTLLLDLFIKRSTKRTVHVTPVSNCTRSPSQSRPRFPLWGVGWGHVDPYPKVVTSWLSISTLCIQRCSCFWGRDWWKSGDGWWAALCNTMLQSAAHAAFLSGAVNKLKEKD